MAIKDALGGLYQLARDLTGTDRKEDPAASIGRTRTYTGTALGPSSDGSVLIQLDSADVVSQDGTDHVTIPTCPSVLAGDRVMVTSVNGTGTVSYVPGEGDRQNAAIVTATQIANDAKAIADAVDQHFFADTNGIHVTTEVDDPAGTHNILINSLGILLRAVTNNLVSITSSAIAFFDGLGNAATNIVASFGASGATIGYASGQHLSIDSDSVDVMNGGTVQSSFSASSVSLGANNSGAVVDFCGGECTISYDALSDTLQIDADNNIILTNGNQSAEYMGMTKVGGNTFAGMIASRYNFNGEQLTATQMSQAVNKWVVSTGSQGDWRWQVYKDGTFDAWCRQGSTSSYTINNEYYGWYYSNQVNNWIITGLSYSQIIHIEFSLEFPTLTFAGIKPVNNNASPPTFGCWIMSPNIKTESGRVCVWVHGII